MNNSIELRLVNKEYPGVTALKNVNFSIKNGELHGLLGPNGAGKSTIMKIICGTCNQSSGELFINGKEIKADEDDRPNIGYLPENPPLYQHMSVKEYLLFVGKLWKLDRKTLRARTEEIENLCALTDVENRIIGNLSKGYKQRVGLAQALIHDPEIIILDEPMVGLDPNAIIEIRELISTLAKNRTVLLSTHQLHEVALICTHISIISRGEIVTSGPINEIKSKFESNQVINATLSNWNTQIEKEVAGFFMLDKIEAKQVDNNSIVRFKSSSQADIRASLSSLLSEKKCGILSFEQEQIELEDIFESFTTNKQHNDRGSQDGISQ